MKSTSRRVRLIDLKIDTLDLESGPKADFRVSIDGCFVTPCSNRSRGIHTIEHLQCQHVSGEYCASPLFQRRERSTVVGSGRKRRGGARSKKYSAVAQRTRAP